MKMAHFCGESVEYNDSDDQDLLHATTFQRWVSELERGTIRCIHFGTECTTFSTAANPPYRNAMYPEGIPGQTMERQAKYEYGTRLLEVTIKLWNAALSGQRRSGRKVFMTLENPAESWMWKMPQLKGILGSCEEGTTNIVLCYCCFGRRFRKRTRLISTFDVSSMAFKCPHKNGHSVVLKGQRPTLKKNWTKIASRCPQALATRWTSLIVSQF